MAARERHANHEPLGFKHDSQVNLPTQKKIAKTKYQNAKRSALRSYDQQKLEIDNKQKVFEDFYADMVKVSPDFELVKTQNSLDYKVWVDSFPVETLTLNYLLFILTL